MVTPFAQFVGSQAAINVIVAARITDQVIQYALGLWGIEGGNMDAAAKANSQPAAGARSKDRASGTDDCRSAQAIRRIAPV
jgi:pyruvate/oxaloacetate carboxyltransferase